MEFYKNLKGSDWASLLPFGIACAAVGYGVKVLIDQKVGHEVNLSIRKSEPKIADSVDIEDIGDKAVFCRCWRSEKFPYCDGSHNKHNKLCQDNVGPLIVKKKST